MSVLICSWVGKSAAAQAAGLPFSSRALTTRVPRSRRPEKKLRTAGIRARFPEKTKKKKMSASQRQQLIDKLTVEMKNAAKLLEFEHAAYLRDKIRELQSQP